MAAYTTIDDPAAYFQVVTYTGDGEATQAITLPGTTDMQPDMIWTKQLSAGNSHVMFDAVRTFAADKEVQVSQTSAEGAGNSSVQGYISAAASDGYTLTKGSGNANYTHADGENYVGFTWKLGTTSGITTNAGTDITPSGYSFNATSGVSAVAYTANNTDDQQIPHGLGAVPHMIWSKCRSAAYQWGMYHHRNTSAPETDFLVLNDTDATSDDATRWSDEAPDSVNWTVGNSNDTNKNTETYIAYVFSEKQGFSKFGSYKGNGNVDGPFLYTGFRPAWFFMKRTDAGSNWTMFHNGTTPGNEIYVSQDINVDNDIDSDTGYNDVDFCANGVKIREDNNDLNQSGSPFVYVCFAEAPLVNSNGVPCNAR